MATDASRVVADGGGGSFPHQLPGRGLPAEPRVRWLVRSWPHFPPGTPHRCLQYVEKLIELGVKVEEEPVLVEWRVNDALRYGMCDHQEGLRLCERGKRETQSIDDCTSMSVSYRGLVLANAVDEEIIEDTAKNILCNNALVHSRVSNPEPRSQDFLCCKVAYHPDGIPQFLIESHKVVTSGCSNLRI